MLCGDVRGYVAQTGSTNFASTFPGIVVSVLCPRTLMLRGRDLPSHGKLQGRDGARTRNLFGWLWLNQGQMVVSIWCFISWVLCWTNPETSQFRLEAAHHSPFHDIRRRAPMSWLKKRGNTNISMHTPLLISGKSTYTFTKICDCYMCMWMHAVSIEKMTALKYKCSYPCKLICQIIAIVPHGQIITNIHRHTNLDIAK